MRKSNEVSLKEALKQMVDHLRMKPRLYQGNISKIWSQKMGTTISNHTTEIRMRERKLYLSIDSSSLKQDLSYSREKIKDMLNKELGEEFIEEVIIR